MLEELVQVFELLKSTLKQVDYKGSVSIVLSGDLYYVLLEKSVSVGLLDEVERKLIAINIASSSADISEEKLILIESVAPLGITIVESATL